MGTETIGIDFGGTSVKIGLLSEVLGGAAPEVVVTADHDGPEALVDAMADVVAALRERCPAAAAVGCGVPGLVDVPGGVVKIVTNVPGWEDIPLRELLAEKTGLPAAIDNDANCMAYAEFRHGAARGYTDVVALTLGTGIGGGLIIGGELYRGSRCAAGEIGQMSIDYRGKTGPYGQPGGLETYIGNRQIGELAAARLHDKPEPEGGWTPKALAERAAAGDAAANDIWIEIADYLGCALASVAWLLNPQAFVIGGGVAKAADLLFEPLERRVRSMVSEVISQDLRILPAQFGNEAGLIGAAALAAEVS